MWRKSLLTTSNLAETASIENVILNALLNDEGYVRKVLPYIVSEYFPDRTHQILFERISGYINKYNGRPTAAALVVDLDSSTLTQQDYDNVVSLISDIEHLPFDNSQSSMEWLIEQTESYCRHRALYNAVVKAARSLDGDDPDTPTSSLPDLLADALAVSFDSNIGHDYSDAESRYDFYHTVEDRIEFDIDALNKVTGGGLPRKSMMILMGGPGGGKSLTMCHIAASAYRAGRRVLYISLEMGEFRIGERFDANLLRTPISGLRAIPKELFLKQIKRVQTQTTGLLKVKEYPTTMGSVNHIRHLLTELKMKQKFVPDLIVVDYLNIMSSSRIKMGANVNSYGYIKAISEELRGLAVENNVALITATQVNRQGMGSSDPDMTEVADSVGTTFTADFFFALSATEEMVKLNQLVFTQLKNRYNDLNFMRKFIVGCDRSRSLLYNIESTAVTDGLENDPSFKDFANTYVQAADDDFSTEPAGESFFSGSLAGWENGPPKGPEPIQTNKTPTKRNKFDLR